jgi:hypothetical protein
MPYTQYARNKIQDFMFGGVTFSAVGTYYLGMSLTPISSSGSNCTEPVGSGYARVAIPNTKSYFTYSSSGCLVNSGSIAFPISSGSWGTIVDLALFDASTSGSVWVYTTAPSPIVVQTNTTVSFSASGLTFAQS